MDLRQAKSSLVLELERNAEAPSIARAAVAGRFEDLLSASLRQTLLLLVSEVVSNAVLHSPAAPDAPILLTAHASSEAVRVTVTDAGGGFTPPPRKPLNERGGHGLYLVDKTATDWGVDRVGGTRVWFELAL